MFVSEVTTRAFSDAALICSRTPVWRRLSASLGACDMNGGEPLLERSQVLARSNVFALVLGLNQGFRQLGKRTFEFGIVRREVQRRLIQRQRLRQVAASPVHVAERTKRGKVLRRALQDGVEFVLCFIELAEVQERPAERDPRGKITGMPVEALPADVDRFLVLAEATAFFGKLGKRNRRRILFDPASKVVQSDVVRHAAAPEGRGYLLTTMVLKVLLLWPASSVTPSTMR